MIYLNHIYVASAFLFIVISAHTIVASPQRTVENSAREELTAVSRETKDSIKLILSSTKSTREMITERTNSDFATILRVANIRANSEMYSKLVAQRTRVTDGLRISNESFVSTVNDFSDAFTEEISELVKSQPESFSAIQDEVETMQWWTLDTVEILSVEFLESVQTECNNLLARVAKECRSTQSGAITSGQSTSGDSQSIDAVLKNHNEFVLQTLEVAEATESTSNAKETPVEYSPESHLRATVRFVSATQFLGREADTSRRGNYSPSLFYTHSSGFWTSFSFMHVNGEERLIDNATLSGGYDVSLGRDWLFSPALTLNRFNSSETQVNSSRGVVISFGLSGFYDWFFPSWTNDLSFGRDSEDPTKLTGDLTSAFDLSFNQTFDDSWGFDFISFDPGVSTTYGSQTTLTETKKKKRILTTKKTSILLLDYSASFPITFRYGNWSFVPQVDYTAPQNAESSPDPYFFYSFAVRYRIF